MTQIKICGLSRREDILYVNSSRPDYCGFIVNFPGSRRNVSPAQVRDLVKNLDPGICPVGVFVNQPIETIFDLAADGTIRAVQLHGSESQEYVKKLKQRLEEKVGKLPVIQAFTIKTPDDIAKAKASSADFILLDRGTGTGKIFDWSLVKDMERPFFLAGGLGPENLREAVRRMNPYAVDMSSGVETNGYKDRKKIAAAVEAVRHTNS